MTIELHINDEFSMRWVREDIREDYTELGIKKYKERIKIVINKIKEEIYENLEYNEYEFYVVYESNLNSMNYTDQDISRFTKECNARTLKNITFWQVH